MSRPIIKLSVYLVALVAIGLVGLWIAKSKHGHASAAAACDSGSVSYWYDPMVPAQHFDKPGKSPFMDMQLVAKCAQTAPNSGESAQTGGKPLYWYDPMHPSEHFDKPGKSPFMDMQLVPRMPGEEDSSAIAGSVAVDPRVVQNLGVRLASVERGHLARLVDSVGLVSVDEHRIQTVQVRASGWVEELAVRATGDSVRRGQLLAAIYSPDLLAAQEELVIAVGSGDAGLRGAARNRLALFGMSDAQISHVEKTGKAERRVNYFAPFDGYVMDLGVRQGAAAAVDTTLFQLADLSSVWINAEVPETQANWLKVGDQAEATVPALPGQHFPARIDYLYPELTTATRTLKVRLLVENPRRLLRPGMFAGVHLVGAPREDALVVPSEAVIKTGMRSVVIVADDTNHFHPALVQVGAEYAGNSEILSGLTAGQQVVASGQFLIDSEASLRGAFDNLTGANPGKGAPMDENLMPMPSGQGN
ncbi:MAG: efflux RND transporter periplasmic adaptor subunit [Proteobacteria bacterium]|nr:efflux RND transporter periplasmic adaptor subunit [Pseudomonadota bacterium]